MAINYAKGDLFKLAPTGAFLLHSCNCKGSWGAGIARQFQFKYPNDYKEYKTFCNATVNKEGQVLITQNNIVCLMVSDFYGKNVSPSDKILKNTVECLNTLVTLLPQGAVVYSPMISSGLFRVPWKFTAELIQQFLTKRPDVKWTVAVI